MTITAEDLKKLPTPTDDSTVAQAGKDTLLYIDTDTTGTNTPKWTLVGGQRESDLDESADSIDASHKTSGGWKVTLPGLKSWQMTYTGLLVLNDDGAQVMEYAFLNGIKVHVKIEYKDKSYQAGWASITKFSKKTPHDGVATIEATLEGAGAISEVTAAS